MLFTISWKGRPEVRDAAAARFIKSGGVPPAGVKLIGRWHDVARISGFAVCETDDPTAMAKWSLDWSDLFELETATVLTDEQAGPLLAAIVKT